MGNTIALIIGLIITLRHHNLLFPSVLFPSVFWRAIERKWERERDKNRQILTSSRFHHYKIKLVSILYSLGTKKKSFPSLKQKIFFIYLK